MRNVIALAAFILLSSCAGGVQLASAPFPKDPLPAKIRVSRGVAAIAFPIITRKRSTVGWRSIADLQLEVSTGGQFGIVPNGSVLAIRIRW